MIQGNVKADSGEQDTGDLSSRVVQFAARNKVLLNALIRSNPTLLEKSLSAMVNNPKVCVWMMTIFFVITAQLLSLFSAAPS